MFTRRPVIPLGAFFFVNIQYSHLKCYFKDVLWKIVIPLSSFLCHFIIYFLFFFTNDKITGTKNYAKTKKKLLIKKSEAENRQYSEFKDNLAKQIEQKYQKN